MIDLVRPSSLLSSPVLILSAGPTVLCIALLAAVVVNFILRVRLSTLYFQLSLT